MMWSRKEGCKHSWKDMDITKIWFTSLVLKTHVVLYKYECKIKRLGIVIGNKTKLGVPGQALEHGQVTYQRKLARTTEIMELSAIRHVTGMWNNCLEHRPIHCSLRLSAPDFWTTLHWAGRQHRVDVTLAQIVTDLKMEASKLPELAMFSRFGKNFESLSHTKKETLTFLDSSSYSSETKAFRLAQKWASETLYIWSAMLMQWCKRRGCKHTPKSFDLSKIWANPLTSGQNHENPGKNDAQHWLTLKNGTQRLQKNA